MINSFSIKLFIVQQHFGKFITLKKSNMKENRKIESSFCSDKGLLKELQQLKLNSNISISKILTFSYEFAMYGKRPNLIEHLRSFVLKGDGEDGERRPDTFQE